MKSNGRYADLAVINANIITVNNRRPRAEALAAKNGVFVAVGSTSEILELVGDGTRVIDAQGKTVVPGFIDAHCHPFSAAKTLITTHLSPTDAFNGSPRKIKSITDIINALKERAETTPRGEWVLGVRYDETRLEEQRHPTRWDLDKVSKDHPIHISHISGHIGVVNSKALELAGLTKESPDPDGGVFERDETGELTGVLKENAEFMFTSGIGGKPPIISLRSEDLGRKALRLVSEKYLSLGITGVGDAWTAPNGLKLYQTTHIPLRVYVMMIEDYFPLLKALGLRSGFGNNKLKIGPIKIVVDGAIAGRTAYLSRPYDGMPGYHGILVKKREELEGIVLEAHKAGYQLAIHANGDKAIEMVLNALEKALEEFPRDNHRHRIEHCTVVNTEILRRIKKLGVVAVPFSTYIYEHGEKIGKYYGDRVSMMFAHKSFLEHGIPVAGSTDNPCGPASPLLAIQTMVTRKSCTGEVLGPEQRISVEDAIKIWTLGSAYASFEEDIKGSIELGKLADFVILSNDPTKTLPASIKSIKVEKVVIGGTVVFE